MKTRAVRLYGVNDIRLEEFELPEPGEDQILARVISDSICMSSHKAALQGAEHKRVPDNVAENPIILGHEFCGELVKVGAKWQDKFKAGQRFSIQPAINYKGSLAAPGSSSSSRRARGLPLRSENRLKSPDTQDPASFYSRPF